MPALASMVHGELDLPACEIATLQGICASGVTVLHLAATGISSPRRTTRNGYTPNDSHWVVASTDANSSRTAEFPIVLLTPSRAKAATNRVSSQTSRTA